MLSLWVQAPDPIPIFPPIALDRGYIDIVSACPASPVCQILMAPALM